MKLVNVVSGKIGTCVIGPKQFLNEAIKLGEAAICIARDEHHARPAIWLVGGIESLIDYVSLAREKGELDEATAVGLLPRLDEAKKSKPTSAIERLASVVGMSTEDLKEIIELAQVAVTAPVEGVKDFSNPVPKLIPKTYNHVSVH